MEPSAVQSTLDQTLVNPTYLNIEYVFDKIYIIGKAIFGFLANPQTWSTIGFISALLSITSISIIIFSLVRLVEIQIHDKDEIDHEIAKAKEREKERSRNTNTRWHYILTLIESPNESDWRVAIIEADSMMEEALRERGLSGETVSELLEGAKDSGYRYIQDAWDGHLFRNKIAHEGTDFPLSQIEGRRIVKMFQNFFEELRLI